MFKIAVKLSTLLLLLLSVACGGGGESRGKVASINNSMDSVSYIIGMNIADNIADIDSINVEVVCRAIRERFSKKSLFSDEDARDYFLKYHTYLLPESHRAVEEIYLSELANANRRFTRTKSGLTYHIQEIGDEKFTPRYDNDLIKVCYNIYSVSGDTLYSSKIKGDTIVAALDEMPDGVKESLKMLGQGGKLEAVIPSKLMYGEQGDESMGVKPYQTLRYEIELIEMEKYGANKLENRFNKGF
ncbi:MAG: FKBP-type peptidyl-prolyl cis-trans isomerase [Rikenellaceae bacterium]